MSEYLKDELMDKLKKFSEEEEVEYFASDYGYIPHEGQSRVTCPRCGRGLFKSYPQSISVDAKIWCWEFRCTHCGHIVGLDVRREGTE